MKYCPTDEMKADPLTKPKQGLPFCVGMSHIKNVPSNYDDEVERKNTDPRLLPKPQPDEGLNRTDQNILAKAMKKSVSFTGKTVQKRRNNTTT